MRTVFVPGYSRQAWTARIRSIPGDFHQRMVQERLRDPEFRAEYERVRAEMFEQLAPAIEGSIVNPGRKRRGRLIFGDDTGRPR